MTTTAELHARQHRNGWHATRRRKLEAQMGPSWIGSEPHWACPTCEEPCSCEGAARFLPHRDCGAGRMTSDA